MHERFRIRIEEGLEKITQFCEKGRANDINVIERRIGRLLESNSRTASHFLHKLKLYQPERLQKNVNWGRHRARRRTERERSRLAPAQRSTISVAFADGACEADWVSKTR